MRDGTLKLEVGERRHPATRTGPRLGHRPDTRAFILVVPRLPSFVFGFIALCFFL